MFHSIQYWNGWLSASDLFDMCTQGCYNILGVHSQLSSIHSIISTDV